MILDEDDDRKKETDAIYQGKPFCLAQQFILTSVPFRILSDTNFVHSHSTQTLDHDKGNKIKSNFFFTYGDTSYRRHRERSFSWCHNSRLNLEQMNG